MAVKDPASSPHSGGPLAGVSGGRPLSQVPAGSVWRVRSLAAPQDVAVRLRELGFCERQRVRLLSRHTHIVCQVCNVRLGISRDLASMIVVEPLSGPGATAGSGREESGP